jgi:hypothetical protein
MIAERSLDFSGDALQGHSPGVLRKVENLRLRFDFGS